MREITRFDKVARRLLYQAMPLVMAVRIALWLLPSRVLFRYASRWNERAKAETSNNPPSIHFVAWSVRVASRRVPGASCLTQALAGQILMGRYGHPSDICIGVARTATGELIAHAWLETEGVVLIGNHDLEQYTRLPDLPSAVHQFGRFIR